MTSIESYGFSMYNGLQVNVKRQMSRGIQFQGAYTWGKDLTDVEGVGFNAVFLGGDGNSNDPNDRHQRWGPADFDRNERFVFTYLWEIPHPAGETFINRRLLSGWTFSGVTTFQSGLPVTITDSLGGSAFGSASNSRASLCPGFTPAQVPTSGGVEARLNNYFNSAAVCPAPVIGDPETSGPNAGKRIATGYGDLGRAAFRGPHQANFDMTLAKSTKVGGLSESATLDFRAEFFNAFNHPQFQNPGSAFGTPSFGIIQATSVAPRLIQFGLRYAF